ncbi:MAG TPA: hypothetical protein VHU61_04670 [Solirubrobacteraceae bacterium]|jgi:hypothetical protein|nr:hypothetical protein [Solirubrobacteraceae bacterium]
MSATEQDLSAADPVQEPVAVAEAVPPVGEEIHLPGGSVLPLMVAIGITLLVIGTTIWWVWSALGFVITLVSVGLWVRDVRRDVDELPEEHHH